MTWYFDHELLLTCAALLAILVSGGIATHWAFRWYRTLKQENSTAGEDLTQLSRTLENEGELEPDEIARVRAAIERQKHPSEPGA